MTTANKRVSPAVRPLTLIADVPRLGAPRIIDVLDRVFAQVDGSQLAIIDRDGAGGFRHTPDRQRLTHARRLRQRCSDHGALLWLTGAAELAALVSADGLQLPEQGLRPREVTSIWRGPCGRSCHDRAGVLAAAQSGADWAMVAPIFAPISKTSTSVPLGLKTLGAIAAASPIPLIGVGGINEERAGHCRQAGAAGVAAMGAVFLADDPVEAVRKLLGAWHDGATL